MQYTVTTFVTLGDILLFCPHISFQSFYPAPNSILASTDSWYLYFAHIVESAIALASVPALVSLLHVQVSFIYLKT